MKIGVIGTGHVGLVTCATLAHIGHRVVGTDSDEEKIAGLVSGRMPYFEPGLEDLVRVETSAGRLSFSADVNEAVADADVVFLCVGTPPRATGEANLAAVEQAGRAVARAATGPVVVVEKSTVPAGTAQRLQRALRRQRADAELHVCSNPEFLREGRAVKDSLEPDRILVGADSDAAFEAMRAVYAPLTAKGIPLIETDIATAELAKHASNAFLALKISFANALARMCELAGADVVRVADVMGSDPRIGRQFLNAGLGYGGYCFPKDIQAFERLSAELGYDFPLLREVARVNEEAIDAAVAKVKEAVWNLDGKRIAVLGLAFKPNTDDTRLSPALALCRALLDEGAVVVGYDPQAAAGAKAELPNLEIVTGPYEAASGAHCAVIATDWDEFATLDLSRLKDAMAEPVIVDGRNVLDAGVAASAGFAYYPTGRPSIH